MSARKLILFAVITSLGLALFLGPSVFADASGTVNKSQVTGNFWFSITDLLGEPLQESKQYAFNNQTLPYFLLSVTQGQLKYLPRVRVSTTPSISGNFASYSYVVTDYLYSSRTDLDPNNVFNSNIPHTLTFTFTDNTSSTYDCTRYGTIVLTRDNNNRPTLMARCAVKVTKKPSNFVHQLGFDTVRYSSSQPYVQDYISYTSPTSGGLYIGTSTYTYEYLTNDDAGGDTPSGDSATADALEDIHKDEKDTINDAVDDAQDSADSMDTSGFTFGNPLASWLSLFTSSNCVSIPKIKSWLHSTENQICTPWNSDIRSNLTPIVSILSITVAFGLLIRWLKGEGTT